MSTDIVLDNSALSLLSCRRKFQLTVIEGLHTPASTLAAFGDAFHKAVELIDKGMPADEAYHESVARAETPFDKLKLLTVLTCYKATQKPVDAITINGKKAIEYKFKWHYGTYVTDTGKRINVHLAGTIDRIYLDGDILVFLDFKTAADYSPDKQKAKVDDYAMAFQLPWYVYNMWKSGLLPTEYLKKLENHLYRTEIIFAFHTPSPPMFRRLTHGPFNDHFIHHEVPLIINNKIADAIKISQLGNAKAPHDGMCVYKACTYCPYRPGCLSMGSEKEEEFVSRFERKPYNPLMFR